MTDYTYNPHRSRIVDVLYVPLLLVEKPEKAAGDMTQKEKDILGDIWQVKEEIKEKLSHLDEDLKRYNLWGEACSIAHGLYMIVLDQGEDPQTVSDLLALFKGLTEEDITKAYRLTLYRPYVEEKAEDIGLLAYLDKVEIAAENKWHWYQAISKPKETIAGLIKVLHQVDELYAPYYEQFAAERQTYLETFSLEGFFSRTPSVRSMDMAEQYQTTYELLLLSPIHIKVCAIFFTEEFKLPIWLILSTRMEDLISSRDLLDMDNFSTILKTMSDISRYQVLTELIKPHAKNKAIAEKLGITGAAVSFHTQKLINSKLLLVDTEDSAVKYQLNQGLVHQLMDKLHRDFDLVDQQTEKEKKDMPVMIKNGIWYDQTGRPLTEEEKAQVKDQVYEELDQDLKDTGFEGLIKKMVKYLMAKNGKGLGKYLHLSKERTVIEKSFDDRPLPTDSSDLADELVDVEDDLADVADELADVNSEIDDLSKELENLSADLERLQMQQEKLQVRRQALLAAYGKLDK